MKYPQYILKRKIEDVLLYPFILLGRIIASLKPLSKEYETFFFFPFYHTGGAEKVHALVTQATGNTSCIVYFTRKSYDKNFYRDFVQSGCTIKDISRFTDNKWVYFLNFIYRGIISGYIDHQKQRPIIFNGQCNFGYKISPWINPSIPQIELLHSFNTFSWIRIPFIPFITRTVMISRLRIEDHLKQYKKLGIPNQYNERIQYIVNGIPLPASIQPKDFNASIKVLYVGRATEEKRVHLIAQMAEKAFQNNLPVEFIFMGDVREAISLGLVKYCKLTGHKSDPAEIDHIYQQAHIVIITSSTEGFPMVIEEGMVRGCIVMATPVGDIPLHVKHKENGFLFTTFANEQLIVKEAIDYLTLICDRKQLLAQMGDRNIEYARQHFSIEAFNRQYQQLFKQLRNQ